MTRVSIQKLDRDIAGWTPIEPNYCICGHPNTEHTFARCLAASCKCRKWQLRPQTENALPKEGASARTTSTAIIPQCLTRSKLLDFIHSEYVAGRTYSITPLQQALEDRGYLVDVVDLNDWLWQLSDTGELTEPINNIIPRGYCYLCREPLSAVEAGAHDWCLGKMP